MDAKEKAIELIDKFTPLSTIRKQKAGSISLGASIQRENAKQCAIICCDEMLRYAEMIPPPCNMWGAGYWQKVKEAIPTINK